MDIQDVRERVRSTFYADLFLMLAGSDRTNMTATEVADATRKSCSCSARCSSGCTTNCWIRSSR